MMPHWHTCTLALPAYWVVSTIRYQLKLHQITHDLSEIARIMNTQKSVTTTLKNIKGETMQIWQFRESNARGKGNLHNAQIRSNPLATDKIRVAP
jgi:hypothetical protein